MDLTAKLNAAANGNQSQQPKVEKVTTAQPSETKRVSNRSITCSQELRDRLRIMAANKGVPMQALLEEWMAEPIPEDYGRLPARP